MVLILVLHQTEQSKLAGPCSVSSQYLKLTGQSCHPAWLQGIFRLLVLVAVSTNEENQRHYESHRTVTSFHLFQEHQSDKEPKTFPHCSFGCGGRGTKLLDLNLTEGNEQANNTSPAKSTK